MLILFSIALVIIFLLLVICLSNGPEHYKNASYDLRGDPQFLPPIPVYNYPVYDLNYQLGWPADINYIGYGDGDDNFDNYGIFTNHADYDDFNAFNGYS